MRLRYVPEDVLEAAVAAGGHPAQRLALVADLCRINALYAIMRAGSGHIGSSFSAMDIVTCIQDTRLNGRPDAVYFSSKGHDAPGLYAVMAAYGVLELEQLHNLRRLGGLPGHPDVGTPGIVTNTGSLGMGISKAKGLIYASRLTGASTDVFVLTGDGELQEGQIWESLAGAVREDLHELTVIVDANRIQSDTWVADVSDLGDIAGKFRAFGWSAHSCDGHEPEAICDALDAAARSDGPSVIVAQTVKGRGVARMEAIPAGEVLYAFHSGAPTREVYEEATDELLRGCHALAQPLQVEIRLEELEIPDRETAVGVSLIPAYSTAVRSLADQDANVVIYDADLVKDTGVLAVAATHPDRFVECGIAEQDMVSQAGAAAVAGLVPIVHSFACFLTTRANEQIFNNATERTKVIYVGSLAGVVPGGPGHSHQSVRDVASMCSIPGMIAVEPCHPLQVMPLLRFLAEDHMGPGYLRLVSVPIELPFDLGDSPVAGFGIGNVLRTGSDVTLLTAGPVTAREALLAADLLTAEGVHASVVATPWLNATDPEWLGGLISGRPVVVVDNHAPRGGLGANVATDLAGAGLASELTRLLAIEGIPVCGTNDEVLRHHGIDALGIAESARDLLRGVGQR